MTDYQKYINALRKCAKEHENDTTYTGHIIVSNLCRDTANLLEALEQEPTTKNDLGVDREDAVERLNALKQLIGYDKDSEIVKATQKGLDMAISALEHPERNVVAIVPCGDTISRQAVIDLMMQKWGENFSGDDAMQESIDAIRVMTSVTPQVSKGHWIDTNDNGFQYHRIYKCSHCGNTVCDYPENIQKYKYCSNCGAKMVDLQESEDKGI